MRFSGKVALVSGGAKGIGAGICKMFVEQGCKVLIADIDMEAAQALAEKLGDAAVAVQLDVRDADQW